MSAAPRDIREEILRYVPGSTSENPRHGIERVVILLLGFLGHGKSSLINSCLCVVKDCEYRNEAGAGKEQGGRTKERTSHTLTNTIHMCDNRGFNKMKPEEILEVSAQLRHLRVKEDVDCEKDNLLETIECIPETYKQPKEFLLPVIVHSCAHKFTAVHYPMIHLLKKCQEITGIYPVVVITSAGPANNRSVNVGEIDRKFGEMGCTRRICLENYTENNQTRNQETDTQFLTFLDVCLEEAEYAIQKRGNMEPNQITAKYVADQVKEEYEVKEKEWKRKLEEASKTRNSACIIL